MRILGIVSKIIIIIIGFTWAVLSVIKMQNEVRTRELFTFDSVSPVTRSIDPVLLRRADSIYYDQLEKRMK